MPTCYIVGAGEFTPRGLFPEKGDLVIAADGGMNALEECGIHADVLIGDFDSLGQAYSANDGTQLIRLPVEKDDTDTAAALAYGYQAGYRSFMLYGCGGGRVDHLLANFQSMAQYSQKGVSVQLVDEKYDAYAITDETLVLPYAQPKTVVSVFCIGGKAEGVTLRGLKYPLTDHTLTDDFPLGVSNEYTEGEASITVKHGTLLVIRYLKPFQAL